MKTHVCLLIFLTVINPVIISAQNFWQQTGGPTGGAVVALAANTNGDIYAGTVGAGIFRSTDNGDHWVQVNENLSDLYIESFAVNSLGEVFVGTYDGVSFSNNNGNSWNHLGLANIPIFSLAINPNGDIFAGISGHWNNGIGIYRSSDHGQSWTPLTNGLPPREVHSIVISSQGIIFLATNGGIYRSANNGDSWEDLYFPGYSAISLTVDTNDDVFAGTGRGIYRSQDNGNTWILSSQGLPPNTAVTSLRANSLNHIFAGTSYSGIFRSTDSGNNWVPVNAGLYNKSTWATCINSSNHIFVGTNGGGIFRSVNHGGHWDQINDGLINTTIYDLAIDQNNRILAGTDGNGLFSSTNSGESWQRFDFPAPRVKSVAFNTSGTIFAGTYEQGMFRSTDGGLSWEPINNGLPANVIDNAIKAILVKPENNYVFLATPNGVFRSTDDGVIWTQLLDSSAYVNCLAMNSRGHILAGLHPRTFKGVYLSKDNGEQWTYLGLILESISAIAINSQDHIFAGTYFRGIYRSTDDGKSWELINDGLNYTWMTGIAINSSDHLFASTWFGGVYKSEDNGNTWRQLISGLPFGIVFSLAVDRNGYVFAGSDGGGVFHSVQPTTSIGLVSGHITSEFFLAQNYPNPFNPQTTIEFNLPRRERVVVEVFNMLGEKIATLYEGEAAPGNHRVSFNAQGLPSGIYFYYLKAPGVTLTKKMVLLR